MNNGHLLTAYHGCDAVTRDDLVSGKLKCLDRSKNAYDWLGSGVYFFENDYDRALIFANAAHKAPEKQFSKRPIATPAVVGAVLRVQRCLDMTTQLGINEFRRALDATIAAHKIEGRPLPKNRPASEDDTTILLRELDRRVFEVIHEIRQGSEQDAYQLVRGAFPQGEPVAKNSGIFENSHIQLAVLDPDCIVGWFLPKGVEMLTKDQYDSATQRRDEAERARKEFRRQSGRAKANAS